MAPHLPEVQKSQNNLYPQFPLYNEAMNVLTLRHTHIHIHLQQLYPLKEQPRPSATDGGSKLTSETKWSYKRQ